MDSDKIYIVCGGWDYEGSNIIALFKSLEEAQLLKEKIEKSGRHYDYIEIQIAEIGEIKLPDYIKLKISKIKNK